MASSLHRLAQHEMKQVKNGLGGCHKTPLGSYLKRFKIRRWILPYAVGENNRFLEDHRKFDKRRLSIKRLKKQNGSGAIAIFGNFYSSRGQLGNREWVVQIGSERDWPGTKRAAKKRAPEVFRGSMNSLFKLSVFMAVSVLCGL